MDIRMYECNNFTFSKFGSNNNLSQHLLSCELIFASDLILTRNLS